MTLCSTGDELGLLQAAAQKVRAGQASAILVMWCRHGSSQE